MITAATAIAARISQNAKTAYPIRPMTASMNRLEKHPPDTDACLVCTAARMIPPGYRGVIKISRVPVCKAAPRG